MTGQHTPGPWRVGNGRQPDTVVADTPVGPGCCDADVAYYGGYLVAESIAPSNRPLIAAAPDLLRACMMALAWMHVTAKGDTPIAKQLRAAIAKARGE
jgi:hypothetical protein